jgi:hypothetical protein
VTVHLGEFKVSYPWMAAYDPAAPADRPPRMVRVIKTEERGSDVDIGAYLMLDACQARCEVAVVVTNDSDLREPVRLLRQELGIPVGVVNPAPDGEARSLDRRDLLPAAPAGRRAPVPAARRAQGHRWTPGAQAAGLVRARMQKPAEAGLRACPVSRTGGYCSTVSASRRPRA